MAGITLAQAEAKLAAWLAAEEAVATQNQSYKIGDRELTRADLDEIGKRITYWDGKVKKLTAQASGDRRTRYFVTGSGSRRSRAF